MSRNTGRRASPPQAKPRQAPEIAATLQKAVALQQQGQLDQAAALYRLILKKMPHHFNALHLLGTIACQRKNYDEAAQLIGRALKANAAVPMAHSNLAVALNGLKRHDEALASCNRALAIAPDDVETLTNCGNALHGLQRHEEALASYDRALTFRPDYVEALNNRGIVLRALGRHDAALESYDYALAIAPDNVAALNGRGYVYMALRRYEDAIADFEHLLRFDPERDYVRGMLLFLRMRCCDWGSVDDDVARLVDDIMANRRCCPPFPLLGLSPSLAAHRRCAHIWVEGNYPPAVAPLSQGERHRHERIRVAYLSPDFRDHAVAHLCAGLFERHDRARFETTAIAFGPDEPGAMRTRLEAAFERFIDVRDRTDRDVAALLHNLEIDIAVDLSGYTSGARTAILASRPAPIQVHYMGYPATMGAPYIDYIIADRRVLPDAHRQHYAEKIVHLPDCYLVNDRTRRIAETVPPRPALGLPETGFVFCCFNNDYKITPAVFDIWMRLLRRVEGSVLWLRDTHEAAARNLRREAAMRAVDPERLIFAPHIALDDHLARQRRADLFLDTLPYNAHATACDALWAGLPVLTCLGESFAGRVAASLNETVGLPDLVTHTLGEYESLAFALADDKARLDAVKATLARNRDTYPLFDTDRFRRHIESAYETMWQRQQRGAPPADFAVAPIP
jgi:protein O-GlcNAc transferase